MTAPNIPVGTRNRTEIDGVFAVVGKVTHTGSGWRRCDVIVIDNDPVGHIHVQEANGRVSAISKCGDRGVLGRDVAWLLRESGKTVPANIPSPQVVAAPAVAGPSLRRRNRP